MKRLHISKPVGGWIVDLRCFGGFLVIYKRDVFCAWWSRDATPPTKREKNGYWIVGNYGTWAQSKYA